MNTILCVLAYVPSTVYIVSKTRNMMSRDVGKKIEHQTPIPSIQQIEMPPF